MAESTRKVLATVRGALRRILRGSVEFMGRVYAKAGEDDIFFLAGGIAFNFLLAAIPFLLLLVAGVGFLLQATLDDPRQVVVEYMVGILPASPRVIEFTVNMVEEVVVGRTRFTVLGIVLLVWVSTRLIGSLRSALRNVFDVGEERGIIAGKLFDAQMVVVAGGLFIGNAAITVALEAVQTYGIELVGLSEDARVQWLQALSAQALAYAFIFLMFVLMYRYLPARRVAWRIALVAATFTAVVFELLKSAFAWYIAYVANYTSTYGYLATTVILVLWIYYSSMVFVLGGEVAQVYELYRIRRRQRELLD